MTRKEEIIKESVKWYANVHWDYNPSSAFCRGAEWADAHQPSPWISVEEQLPEDLLTCEWVAVKLKDYPGWYRGYYSGIMWHYIDECGDEIRAFNVTHWMPIPKL